MIIFGIILLIIAALIPKLAVLWTIGIIVIIIGLVLLLLNMTGHGSRYY